MENLVILWHGHTEDDGRNVLKTMNPFLSLGSLPAHIEQLEVEVLEWKVNLYYAGGLDPGPEDILFSRLVVLCSKSVKIIKETVKGRWLNIRLWLYYSITHIPKVRGFFDIYQEIFLVQEKFGQRLIFSSSFIDLVNRNPEQFVNIKRQKHWPLPNHYSSEKIFSGE